jgi:uncharacterized integral membrane protein
VMLRIVVWIKRVFILLWLMVLVFISAAITADNPQQITLHLLGKSYQASAGFLFMVSLGFGALLGVALLLPRVWLLQRKVRKLLKNPPADKTPPV